MQTESQTPGDRTRKDVELGWVLDSDDARKLFYVHFSTQQPKALKTPAQWATAPFKMRILGTVAKSLVLTRPGQVKFRRDVFAYYGPACCVCDRDDEPLLDAAHIYDKRNGGTDDPRNGLVLCALHHRALDRLLFGIQPGTHTAGTSEEGADP